MTVQGRRCVRLRKGAHFHASGSLRGLGSPRQSSQSQKSEDGDLVPRRSPSAGDLEPRPGCCRSARPGGGARFPPPPAPPLSSGPPLLLLPLARKAMCTYLSLSPQKSPASPPDEKQRAWRGQEPGSPGPFPGPSVSPRMGTREPPPGGEMWALSPRLPGSGGAPRPPPRGSFLGKPEREADRQAEKQRRRGRHPHSACSCSKYSPRSGRRFRLLGAPSRALSPSAGPGRRRRPSGTPGPPHEGVFPGRETGTRGARGRSASEAGGPGAPAAHRPRAGRKWDGGAEHADSGREWKGAGGRDPRACADTAAGASSCGQRPGLTSRARCQSPGHRPQPAGPPTFPSPPPCSPGVNAAAGRWDLERASQKLRGGERRRRARGQGAGGAPEKTPGPAGSVCAPSGGR